jgi:hypothetical protein
MTMLPPLKPRLSTAELERLLEPYAIERQKYPLLVVGIRGYYRDSMGKPGVNDRGIYDDALFIHSPYVTASYNGNVDPSKYLEGQGFGQKKGMASLNNGFWPVYRFDLHKGKYLALCQRAGKVTVTRDGDPPYQDTGDFGVNIHMGGWGTTGSEACQTIHPDQWTSFIRLAEDQARRIFGDELKDDVPAWKSAVVAYALFDPQSKGASS